MAGHIRGLLERLLARRRQSEGEGVSDAELLRRFTRERDEAAFELLVWRHGSMVLAVCRRAVRDEQLAEDAFQAVFLVLARKAAGVRGNLGGWLFKVARRVSARALKKQLSVQPAVETPAVPVSDSVVRAELSDVLDSEVARLPERLRRPVVLCYLGGQSTEDAARELGCPRGTVLSRLATARKRLAERLTRRGVTLPATLATAGLSPQLVSSAAAAAPAFRTGALSLSNATQLAEGVLRTMRRVTILTAMGGVVLAAGLVTGFGWIASQPGGNTGAASTAAAAPVAPLPDDPPAPPKLLQPDPAAERKALDDRRRKLEQLAERLKLEIEAKEKSIELLGRANDGIDDSRRALLQKHHAEAAEEYRKITREVTKIEAELSVLKKLVDAKEGPPLDPLLVEEAVRRDPTYTQLNAELERTRANLNRALELGVGVETPQIKTQKEQIAALEKKISTARKQAAVDATELLRASEKTAMHQRIAKLETESLIKKEIREKFKAERDEVQKLLAAGASGGFNIAELQKSLEPEREMLGRLNRELLLLRAQASGITLPEPSGTDAKLDAILRELAALRKEVQEFKAKQK